MLYYSKLQPTVARTMDFQWTLFIGPHHIEHTTNRHTFSTAESVRYLCVSHTSSTLLKCTKHTIRSLLFEVRKWFVNKWIWASVTRDHFSTIDGYIIHTNTQPTIISSLDVDIEWRIISDFKNVLSLIICQSRDRR